MRSCKTSKQDKDLALYNEFWNMFSGTAVKAHVFDTDYWDGEVIDGSKTFVPLCDYPMDLMQSNYDYSSYDDDDCRRIRSMISAVTIRLGEDGMYEVLLKSMRAVDKLVMDTPNITSKEADGASGRARYHIACKAARMAELYEAASEGSIREMVEYDLAAMFPGLVFMIMWRRVMWDIYAHDGVSVYTYYRDDKTLEDAVRLFSKKLVDYAYKFRREYGENTADPG